MDLDAHNIKDKDCGGQVKETTKVDHFRLVLKYNLPLPMVALTDTNVLGSSLYTLFFVLNLFARVLQDSILHFMAL